MLERRGALLLLAAIGFPLITLYAQVVDSRRSVTREDIGHWEKELSNWGRWGKNDQIGTLNLVTAKKRIEAAKLVKEGFSVSLARTAMTETAPDNSSPYVIERSGHLEHLVAIDGIAVQYHGSAHTHLDAMDHVFKDDGKAYNGYAFDELTATSQMGHPRNAVLNLKDGIYTRGILIDIPRLKGVPYLEPGTAIFAEDIEAWERNAGVRVSPGDAVFIRTGRWARRRTIGPWQVNMDAAGLDVSVIPWLKKQDISVLGSDGSQKVTSASLPDLGSLGNVHDFALSVLGIHLLDNCDLEALAQAAAARHRWEFQLTAAPLPIPGGTGSPINPIATF